MRRRGLPSFCALLRWAAVSDDPLMHATGDEFVEPAINATQLHVADIAAKLAEDAPGAKLVIILLLPRGLWKEPDEAKAFAVPNKWAWHPSVCLCARLSVRLAGRGQGRCRPKQCSWLFVWLSVCSSVRRAVRLSASLPVCLFANLSVCLSVWALCHPMIQAPQLLLALSLLLLPPRKVHRLGIPDLFS
jgi:hypothetical protein